jgi:hypothetical protein
MRAGASDSRFTGNDRGTGPATSVSPAHSAHQNDEPVDEGDAAEFEIEQEFRRKLMGTRQIPRRERAQARRAAREWRRLALNALRQKRMHERHARHMLWRLAKSRPPDRGYG